MRISWTIDELTKMRHDFDSLVEHTKGETSLEWNRIYIYWNIDRIAMRAFLFRLMVLQTTEMQTFWYINFNF